jgi:chromosome segregation ATPase
MDPSHADLPTATPADALATERQSLERERAALRIQAAAVVAQQAALTEQELHLQQQKQSLDRQQEQLAAHLDARRQQLLDLQQRVRQAREDLRAEQRAQQAQLRENRARWIQGQSELAQAVHGAKSERKHLQELRQRLKKRWHRQWAGERSRLQKEEQALAERQAELDRQAEDLQRERATLAEQRLCFTGEVEVSRRDLRDARQELRDAQRAWKEHCRHDQAALDQTAANLGRLRADLVKAQREMAIRRADAEQTCARLAQEADGLELRVGNLRRKLLEQEQECRRFHQVIAELKSQAPSETPNQPTPESNPTPKGPRGQPGLPIALPIRTNHDRERSSALEGFAAKLRDGRGHLLEQCARLLQAWELWLHDHEAVTTELNCAGEKLAEREEDIARREQELVLLEDDLHRRRTEAAQLHQQSESWQVRLRAAEADWRADREVLLAKVRHREIHIERQTALIASLRERWAARRRKELEDLRAERARCHELQSRYVELCEESLLRNQTLERQARELAVRALSIEEYRLHIVSTSTNVASAERRVVRLRRRWDKRFAAAERKLARDGHALAAAMDGLDDQLLELRQLRDDLSAHEQALDQDLAAWEHEQTAAEVARSRMEAELESHRLHRAALERLIGQERTEIERVTHTMLLENHTEDPAIMRAA